VAATEGTAGRGLRVDLTIADRVEKELGRAREAVAAADADAAERALARAETLLRDHPELPQAAWLRAEVHRSWAARWTRIEPRDEQRALTAWQDAEALDGGRAAGIGEPTFTPRPHTTATLSLQGGGGRRLVARLNGVPLVPKELSKGVTTFALDVPATEHQVVVTLDGEMVFASWIAIPDAPDPSPAPVIALHVGDDGACTLGSFANVAREGGGIRAAGVSCQRWLVASPAERPGAVLVARCESEGCGPFLEWRSDQGLGGGPTQPVPPHAGKWPAWATWTAVGVGAVAVTTIVLVATGVFEARASETRFVAGGVRTE
jgi:hypothetical protein